MSVWGQYGASVSNHMPANNTSAIAAHHLGWNEGFTCWLQEAAQQLRELQKQNKALVAELERLQRVKDARISQLEQVWGP